eukprot:scaffold145466_cov127-Phaeocystis_antarctica.AAC.1
MIRPSRLKCSLVTVCVPHGARAVRTGRVVHGLRGARKQRCTPPHTPPPPPPPGKGLGHGRQAQG